MTSNRYYIQSSWHILVTYWVGFRQCHQLYICHDWSFLMSISLLLSSLCAYTFKKFHSSLQPALAYEPKVSEISRRDDILCDHTVLTRTIDEYILHTHTLVSYYNIVPHQSQYFVCWEGWGTRAKILTVFSSRKTCVLNLKSFPCSICYILKSNIQSQANMSSQNRKCLHAIFNVSEVGIKIDNFAFATNRKK